MKKLLFLGLLLGIAGEVKAITKSITNRGSSTVKVNIQCASAPYAEKLYHIAPGQTVNHDYYGAACTAILHYPGVGERPAWVRNANLRNIVIYQDRNGGYHWE